jgi:invasion protein IalB
MSKYNPYGARDTTGPGPAGVKKHRRKEWDCKCHVEDGHEQVCECTRLKTKKGKKSKAVKVVRNDLRKKRKYRIRAAKWAAVQKRKGKR